MNSAEPPRLYYRIEDLLAWQPVEVLEELAARLSKSVLRRHRLDERDAQLCGLVAGRVERSSRGLTNGIRVDLVRYAATAYRFDTGRALDDPRRAMMCRVLDLNGGKVPSKGMIRRALAGANFAAALRQKPAQHPTDSRRGSDAGLEAGAEKRR